MTCTTLDKLRLVYLDAIEIKNKHYLVRDVRTSKCKLLDDSSGKIKVIAEFDDTKVLSDCLILVKNKGKMYCTDENGNNILDNEYDGVYGYNGTFIVGQSIGGNRVDVYNLKKKSLINSYFSAYVAIYDRLNYFLTRDKISSLDKLYDENGKVIIDDKTRLVPLKDKYILSRDIYSDKIKLIDIKKSKVVFDYNSGAKLIRNRDNTVDLYVVIDGKMKHYERMAYYKESI